MGDDQGTPLSERTEEHRLDQSEKARRRKQGNVDSRVQRWACSFHRMTVMYDLLRTHVLRL